jgi:hypothetical protein
MPHIDTIIPHTDTHPHTDTTTPHTDVPKSHSDAKPHSDTPASHNDRAIVGHIDAGTLPHNDVKGGGEHVDFKDPT